MTTNGTAATFDGKLHAAPADMRDFTPGSDDPGPDDDLNPNNIGFGVKGEHASNMDNNEGFSMVVTAGGVAQLLLGLQFSIDQQGNTDDTVMAFQLVNSTGGDPSISGVPKVAPADGETAEFANSPGGSSNEFYLYTTLPNGNNDIIVTILQEDLFDAYVANQKVANEIVVGVDGEFDEAAFRFNHPDDFENDDFTTLESNDSVRVKDISLIQQIESPDLQFIFEAQGTDGDGDMTTAETFVVSVDGDGDGSIVV